jgi:uncharacterized membrane protein YeaQ/YmgE (transglycosylase-associated protein family)
VLLPFQNHYAGEEYDWLGTCRKKSENFHKRKQVFVMTLFAWLLLGLLAGFIASHLVNHRGEGMVLDILLGIVGAIVGGWIAYTMGFAGIARLNLYSIMVATAGSILVLFVYHAIRRNVLARRVF